MGIEEPRSFLEDPVLAVAPQLLGMRVRTSFDGLVTEVMLDEVEAYAGAEDPASHAFRGRTPRNGAMFEAAGTLYVYRSYGIHWCMNIVTGPPGLPHAVLLRGGRPVVGEDTMVMRRGRADHIADGPGKLTQALGVTGVDNATSVLEGSVMLIPGRRPAAAVVESTPRIGISRAVERPWRFRLIER